MVETIQKSNGLWHILLAEKDLIEQAGLNPDDIKPDFGFLRYKERAVIMSHTYNKHIVVSMEGEDDADLRELIDAFSKVVEYEPFCKYTLISRRGTETLLFPTYEWDKENPEERYEELSKMPTVEDLVRI